MNELRDLGVMGFGGMLTTGSKSSGSVVTRRTEPGKELEIWDDGETLVMARRVAAASDRNISDVCLY